MQALHSNMDRLKQCFDEEDFNQYITLHSNMDRLKPVSTIRFSGASITLHSNMDRLKPFFKNLLYWRFDIFTFQYG